VTNVSLPAGKLTFSESPTGKDLFSVDLLEAEIALEKMLAEGEHQESINIDEWWPKVAKWVKDRFKVELTKTQTWLFATHVRETYLEVKKNFDQESRSDSGFTSTHSPEKPME